MGPRADPRQTAPATALPPRPQPGLLLLRHDQHPNLPESREFYDRKRAEGKKHTQAVLALARRSVNVLWALLREDRPYPPTAAQPQAPELDTAARRPRPSRPSGLKKRIGSKPSFREPRTRQVTASYHPRISNLHKGPVVSRVGEVLDPHETARELHIPNSGQRTTRALLDITSSTLSACHLLDASAPRVAALQLALMSRHLDCTHGRKVYDETR